MGVNFERGKYRARVYHEGKNHSLGMFDTERKAKMAINRFKKNAEKVYERKVAHADFQLGFEDMKPKPRLRSNQESKGLNPRAIWETILGKIYSWRR